MSNTKRDCQWSKRNVWKNAEVNFFLKLMKEQKILGLMDGKALRVSVFKSLEDPMNTAGFIRDAPAMQMKFKNLKRDYFRDRRSNCVSDKSENEFYHQMDDLLGDRPVATRTKEYESHMSKTEEAIAEMEFEPHMIKTEEVNDEEVDALEFVNVAGPLSAEMPSCSETASLRHTHIAESHSRSESASSWSDNPSNRRKNTSYQETLEKFIEIQKEMKDTFSRVAANLSNPEQDQIIMETMLNRHESMLKNCTDTLVAAIKGCKHKKKKRRNNNSSSSSASE